MLSQSTPIGTGPTQLSSWTYNQFGEVLNATDPLGNITQNTYDGHGNLLTITSPAPGGGVQASTSSFTYDQLGEVLTYTDPLGHITTYTWNSVGLLQTSTDPNNNVTTFTYDGNGNLTQVTDALLDVTKFAYDVRNRLILVTYPDSSTTQYAYDSRGRRINTTDGNNHTTGYQYDDADRLIAVTDALNRVVQYAYDTESNLTSVTDPATHTTSFAYDNLGRVTQTTFPSMLTETVGYDQNGNVISKTDRNGNAFTATYDSLNRRVAQQYPGGSVSYTYDLASHLTSVVDGSGTYSFVYDGIGRRTSATTQYSILPGTTFTVGYAYDAASRRQKMTDNEGSQTTYTYDGVGNLSGITAPSGQYQFTLDALNRMTQLVRPNPMTTSYTYDSQSRVLSILHNSGGTAVDGSSYTYDGSGNRLTRSNSLDGTNDTYGYDQVNELGQVQHGPPGSPSVTEQYVFDAVGNRSSSLTVPSYTYNSSNQLTASADGTSYVYDQNGNMTSQAFAGAATTYTWNSLNQLAGVTLPGTQGSVSFVYDPFGRRIEKVSPSGTTVYLYDGPNELATYDGSGNLKTKYENGLGTDKPLAVTQNGSSLYFEADGLGSVSSVSNSVGALDGSLSYSSFGSTTLSPGAFSNPRLYAARDFDSETGLYFNRARYYNPAIGRFISEDPVRFGGGVNFYVYTNNNPTDLIDPSGFCGRAPNKQNIFTCASEFASKYSIAGGLQAMGVGRSGVGGFITNALGGNAFSGATDLIHSLGSGEGGGHSVFYNMGQSVVAGPTQGFGAAFGRFLKGTPAEAALPDLATSFAHGIATAEYGGLLTDVTGAGLEFASGVGEVKLGVDAAVFAIGLAKCGAKP